MGRKQKKEMISKAYKRMNETKVFKLDGDYITDDNFYDLQNALRKFGIWINILRPKTTAVNKKNVLLIISYDIGKFKRVNARGAGRKISCAAAMQRGITVRDVQNLRKRHAVYAVCDILGISRSTFYRYMEYHCTRKSKWSDSFLIF